MVADCGRLQSVTGRAASDRLVGAHRGASHRNKDSVYLISLPAPRRRTMALVILGMVVAALIVLFLIPGSTPRIDTRRHRHSLAVLEQVPVNDTQQWVLIRSEDVANPVVLFVHGGPGTSQLTLMRKNTQPLERYFTVVNWDQRRAARSFAAGREDASMAIRTIRRRPHRSLVCTWRSALTRRRSCWLGTRGGVSLDCLQRQEDRTFSLPMLGSGRCREWRRAN